MITTKFCAFSDNGICWYASLKSILHNILHPCHIPINCSILGNKNWSISKTGLRVNLKSPQIYIDLSLLRMSTIGVAYSLYSTRFKILSFYNLLNSFSINGFKTKGIGLALKYFGRQFSFICNSKLPLLNLPNSDKKISLNFSFISIISFLTMSQAATVRHRRRNQTGVNSIAMFASSALPTLALLAVPALIAGRRGITGLHTGNPRASFAIIVVRGERHSGTARAAERYTRNRCRNRGQWATRSRHSRHPWCLANPEQRMDRRLLRSVAPADGISKEHLAPNRHHQPEAARAFAQLLSSAMRPSPARHSPLPVRPPRAKSISQQARY